MFGLWYAYQCTVGVTSLVPMPSEPSRERRSNTPSNHATATIKAATQIPLIGHQTTMDFPKYHRRRVHTSGRQVYDYHEACLSIAAQRTTHGKLISN